MVHFCEFVGFWGDGKCVDCEAYVAGAADFVEAPG